MQEEGEREEENSGEDWKEHEEEGKTLVNPNNNTSSAKHKRT